VPVSDHNSALPHLIVQAHGHNVEQVVVIAQRAWHEHSKTAFYCQARRDNEDVLREALTTDEAGASIDSPVEQSIAPGTSEAENPDRPPLLLSVAEKVSLAPEDAGIEEPPMTQAIEMAVTAAEEASAGCQTTRQEAELPEATTSAIEPIFEPPRSEAGELPDEEASSL